MTLIEFPEQTRVIAKDQPEYRSMPAHVSLHQDGRTTCCWRLTWRERLRVLFRGVVWHQMLTFHQPLQPQKLTTDKPEMTP